MLGTRRSEEIFEQPDRHDRYSVRSTTITIRVMLSIPREIRASRWNISTFQTLLSWQGNRHWCYSWQEVDYRCPNTSLSLLSLDDSENVYSRIVLRLLGERLESPPWIKDWTFLQCVDRSFSWNTAWGTFDMGASKGYSDTTLSFSEVWSAIYVGSSIHLSLGFKVIVRKRPNNM